MNKKLMYYGISILLFISIVGAYSTYGAPSEFGNATDTTVLVGGDYGIVNATGNITTQSWFKGLFNWTSFSNWISFDGSLATFNESKLNSSIIAVNATAGAYTLYVNTTSAGYSIYVNSTMKDYVDSLPATNHTSITFGLYNSTWDNRKLIIDLNATLEQNNTKWVMSGTDLYYNDGNVGIGNASPDHELSVNGDLYQDNGYSYFLDGVKIGGTGAPAEILDVDGRIIAGNLDTHTELYSVFEGQTSNVIEVGSKTSTANSADGFGVVTMSNNVTNINGIVGAIGFANMATGETEKRTAFITALNNGAVNSGLLRFQVNDAGTIESALDITGTVINFYEDVNLGNQALTAAGTINRGYYVYKSGTMSYGMKLQYDGSEYGTMIFGPNQADRFINFGKMGASAHDDDMIDYMRIDLDNGNVGIGTTAPKWNLEVNGNVSLNSSLYVLNNGNVGIGTTAPPHKLSINAGDIGLNDSRKLYLGNADDVSINFNGSATHFTNEVGSGDWIFNSGNVGIGTTSPDGLLHIAKDTSAEMFIIERTTGGATGKWGIKLQGATSVDFRLVDMTNSKIPFVVEYNAPTDSLVVDSSGNVGIGTIAPTTKLNVVGNMNLTGNFTGNQFYGEMFYHNHTGTQLNFAVDGLYYFMFMHNATHMNGFTANNLGSFLNSSLMAQVSGLYKVTYSAIGDGQNNHIYISSIFINELNKANCDAHRKMTAGGDVITMTGDCFVRLNTNDNVSIRVADVGATGTGNYYGGNVNLMRVGS